MCRHSTPAQRQNYDASIRAAADLMIHGKAMASVRDGVGSGLPVSSNPLAGLGRLVVSDSPATPT